MSFTKGNKALWDDISNLFTSLNTARNKHGFSSYEVATQQGQLANTSVPTQIKNLITEMKNDSYVGNIANVSFTMPTVGDLLNEQVFINFQDTITNIQNTCRHRSAFFSADYVHDSADYTTNLSTNKSTNKSTNFSTDYAFSANQSFHYNGFTWDGRKAF